MADSTHIRIDKATLGKLRNLAGDRSLADFLRSIANGKDDTGELTHKDLAIQIGASQSMIIKRLGELEATVKSAKHDDNK